MQFDAGLREFFNSAEKVDLSEDRRNKFIREYNRARGTPNDRRMTQEELERLHKYL